MQDRKDKKLISPEIAHKKLSKMYQWDDVAGRVEKIYNQVTNESVDSLSSRLRKYVNDFTLNALKMFSGSTGLGWKNWEHVIVR